jgi:hypothetical protein
MRLPKLLTAAALALFLIMGVTGSASSSSVTIQWTLPTHTALNNDCNQAGYPIPTDKPIITRVQWRTQGATSWTTHLDTPNRAVQIQIPGLAPETAYEIRIGPHYGDGNVLCWSDTILVTTPGFEPPQGCTNVQVLSVD